MRATWAAGVLLLGALLAVGALVDPVLAAGVLAGVLCWALLVHRGRRPLIAAGPLPAARAHARADVSRGAPRQRDPDAPGHTRSRAPSETHPAV